MTGPSQAVFLSYASQDAEAAQRICVVLRGAGIEVWFDQSELRGGDAWDSSIRRQIRECALFLAVISVHTNERDEGYFRREWNLAVERTIDMAGDKPFLLPVVIDGTLEPNARVPDKFRHIQWTRLPDGVAPAVFVERVSRLLSPGHAPPALQKPPVGTASASLRPVPEVAPSRWKGPAVLPIAAIAVIGIGYLALAKFVLSKHGTDVARTVATAQSSVAESLALPGKSIAVLPFVDMSGKHDQEYFSDGLTEELIDLLGRTEGLQVIARTSSFYFKNRRATIGEIAKTLGVANILEGSVRKDGDTLRVSAQLIRTDTGVHLWSETYDRNLQSIFKVQDDIAASVVAALKVQLMSSLPRTDSGRTANTEAYNQYLLGKSYYIFSRTTPAANDLAVVAFRKAIVLDPDYAAAHAELALAEYYSEDWLHEAGGKARAFTSAERAIELAPNLADGYESRGYLRYNTFDWPGAQADLQKALLLDPNATAERRRYSQLLATLGRLSEAIETAKKAIEADPLSDVGWDILGNHLVASGQLPAARSAFTRALEINPADTRAGLFLVELLSSQPLKALDLAGEIEDPQIKYWALALVEHTLGRKRESQTALRRLMESPPSISVNEVSVAEVYAWRAEKDKSLEWLNKAYTKRNDDLTGVAIDPLLASLRSDPRYKAFLRKMNLLE